MAITPAVDGDFVVDPDTCGFQSEWISQAEAEAGEYLATMTTIFNDGTQCVVSEAFTLAGA